MKPAAYTTSNLEVSPNSVEAGNDITVSFKVINTGEVSGKYTGALQIDGATEATKEVTLARGESQQVTFTVKRSQPGTYNVAVGNLSASFTYLKPATFEASGLAVNPTTIPSGKPVTVNFKISQYR